MPHATLSTQTGITDFIGHPDLVAERLVRYAGLVGRENILAGTGLRPRHAGRLSVDGGRA
jgi:hypothetical protein